MDSDEKLEQSLNKIEPYMITVIIASFLGVLSGLFGALFITTLNIFTEARDLIFYSVLIMPLIGVLIVYINKKYPSEKENGLLIDEAVNKEKDIPKSFLPSLFTTTVLSHFAGASIGRMEAPIKMGGSLGNYIAKFFSLKEKQKGTIIASGVAGLFSAVFGTPLTASVVALELSKYNKKNTYVLPIILSSCFSRFICFAFGIDSFIDKMLYLHHPKYELKQVLIILAIVVICILFSFIFNKALKITKDIFKKVKNEYLRIIIGSIIMIICLYFLNNTLFCGNNTYLVEKALSGNDMWYIFIVKTILTAICLASGFRGGNIGPAFVVGASLGTLLATLMGIDPLIGAAIGAITLFTGITKLLISGAVLGLEIFGAKMLPFFIIVSCILKKFQKTN